MLHHSTSEMASFLKPGKHVHLIGIGGVSMCALGMVLHGMGIQVTGSDMNQSKTTDHLEETGIPLPSATEPKTFRGQTASSALPLSTTRTPKLSLPHSRVSLYLNVPSPGATS